MATDQTATVGASKLLVVEDDAQLSQLLREQLTLAGYETTTVGSLSDAREALATSRFDLVLLDLNLPDGDGLDLAREVSADQLAPLLMLTARGDVESRVAGLYAGASDYLTKPFSVPELLARVHVRLRDRGAQQLYSYGALTLDQANGSCAVGGQTVHLPEREFELLRLLIQYRGRVFTKDDLERALYGIDVPDSNTIEVFVYNLRRKLSKLGMDEVIRTVRSRGYVVV